MMTRKNYIEFARIMREAKANAIMARDERTIDSLRKVEDGLVRYLSDDNPNFCATRFREACDPYCI